MTCTCPEDKGDKPKRPPDTYVSVILLVIFLAGLTTIVFGGIFEPNFSIVPALIWAFGFCASGMLLGFLFGIPRTLPAGTVVADAQPARPGSTDTPGSSSPSEPSATEGSSTGQPREINSNLVEVSDWLTKIIVGVGLVELKKLPRAAQSVAEFIAPSLGVIDLNIARPVAGSIMMFFSVHGFLIGYLLTRIYLAVVIKHADHRAQ